MAGDFTPVNIDSFKTGIILNCPVYSSKDLDDLHFIGEGLALTETIKEKLKKIALRSNIIYIPRRYALSLTQEEYGDPIEPEDEHILSSPLEPLIFKIPAEPKKTSAPSPVITSFKEVNIQYQSTRNEAADLLSDTAGQDNQINVSKAENITNNVHLQLKTFETSLIIQSINSMRNVDEYLYTHSLNVAFLNGLMGKWLNYDKEQCDELVKIGLMHDFGKLKIPSEILNKPASLTKSEFEIMKKHPFFSFEMLLKSGNKNEAVLRGVVQHHEKVNGRGYPSGLSVDKITEYAKITSISDIYDAMVAKRVYKEPHSPFEILESFSKEGYSELDIKYVKLFIDCMIEELKGKKVLLSDGTVAKVWYVKHEDLMYPIVEREGEIIATSQKLYTVSMFNEDISIDRL